ncbi:hypothetical protein R3P38DRAFT_2635464 [Favolaschia claudopus]|uniref:Uncharacterized protein n=1 Tax=Favolaschia claudopus TaxID=2862362 RepID=A0AAW0AWE1_9AGAR
MSSIKSESILPLYISPPAAPSLPPVPLPSTSPDSTASTNGSADSYAAFVYPIVPPPDDPFVLLHDGTLPRVSRNPLPPNHERVETLTKYRARVYKCANCAEGALCCRFDEAGKSCGPCAARGVPDCCFTEPGFLLDNLVARRDRYFNYERVTLANAVHAGSLHPSRFNIEYERAGAFFYSAAQGAINRFLMNSSTTKDLVYGGISDIMSSSDDPTFIIQFLSFSHDKMHPRISLLAVERLHAVLTSCIS